MHPRRGEPSGQDPTGDAGSLASPAESRPDSPLEQLLQHLPSIGELYRRYQYTPQVPESTTSELPPVNLAEPTVTDRLVAVAEALVERFERSNPDRNQEFRMDTSVDLGPSVTAVVNLAPSSQLRFGADPIRHKLEVTVARSDSSIADEQRSLSRIAAFFAYLPDRKNPDWLLHHRIVNPIYRRTGAGSGLLSIFEQVIQAGANRYQRLERLTIDASQVEVLLFALKRGYRPATPEDEQRLVAFLTDDGHRFFVGDDLGWGDTGRRPGFIVERSERLAEKVYDHRSMFGELEGVARVDPANLDAEADVRWVLKRLDPDEVEALAYTINLTKAFRPSGPPEEAV